MWISKEQIAAAALFPGPPAAKRSETLSVLCEPGFMVCLLQRNHVLVTKFCLGVYNSWFVWDETNKEPRFRQHIVPWFTSHQYSSKRSSGEHIQTKPWLGLLLYAYWTNIYKSNLNKTAKNLPVQMQHKNSIKHFYNSYLKELKCSDILCVPWEVLCSFK